MKKTISILFVALFFATATSTNTGCVKSSGSTPVPGVNLPDIANFTIKAASAFIQGASSLISVASSTLAAGTYTIFFDITGENNLSNQSATLTMSGGTGTFNTPALSTAGISNIVIKKITNSAGGSASFTSTVTKSFSDSSGLMTCNINGAAYRATHVNASWLGSGGILSIHAVLWDPLTTITLYWDDYNGTLGTRYFNTLVNVPGAWNSVYNGGSDYGAPGIAELGANGTVIVTAKTANTITGTFSFTCDDSTRVTTGSFNCKLN